MVIEIKMDLLIKIVEDCTIDSQDNMNTVMNTRNENSSGEKNMPLINMISSL